MAMNKLNSKSEKNKPLFAAYINMARNNMFLVIKHISTSLQLNADAINEATMQECELLNLLRNYRKPELTQRAIKMIERYMPFLKPMLATEIQNINKVNDKSKGGTKKISNTITPQMYHQGLVLLIKTLNAYRNEYTHFDAVNCWSKELLSQQQLLIQYLKKTFDGGRIEVKERFSLTEKDLEFLTGKERYDAIDMLDENGNVIYKNGRRQKKYRERNDYYYKLDRKQGEYYILSSTGLIMFIAMFLHKQYTKILIDKSGLFRDRRTTEKEKKTIFEIFCIYHLKLINDRIESSQPQYALGLDMLNELQKCPKELYETLCDKDKAQFRVINDEGNENLLMRYRDRFPQLAMRYIDQYNVLPSMCFQVALGKYKHTFYDKKCADATHANRVRSLEKDISGYGKIEAVELARKQQYGAMIKDPELIDSAQSTPYITDCRATYMITGKRIGIMYNDDHRRVLKNNLYLPQLNGKNTRNEYPVCWLSVYELPALLYHHLLSVNNTPDATATIIKQYVNAYRNLFTDIANGALTTVGEDKYDETIGRYGLKPTAVPKEIQNYLKGIEVDIDDKINEHFYSQLDEILSATKQRLDSFEADLKATKSKDNKFGKKQYVTIKPGKIAAWIAQDLVKWLPSAPKKEGQPEGWNKPTGLNFSVMQSTLALYNGEIDRLRRVFMNLEMIGGEYPHCFLQKVLDSRPVDVLHLYKQYLIEKQRLIERVLDERVSEKEFEKIGELFIPSTQRRWKRRTPKWYQNLASKYLQAPIELPRGLFEQPIKTLVKEHYAEDEDIMALLNKERCNVAHLIVEAFKIYKGDDSQQFYDAYNYRRTYRYFNIVNNHKVRNKLTELYLTTDEMLARATDIEKRNQYLSTVRKDEREEESKRLVGLLNHYKDNEKTIRRYRVQDVIMYLLSNRILVDNRFENIDTYHLKDIYPNSDGGVLSMPITFELTLKMKDGSTVTIKQENLKIKNYGDFYQFIYDERVLSLLPYIREAQIDRSELVKELEAYEANRPEVFAIIHQYEKNIIQNTPNDILHQQIEVGGKLIDVKNNFRTLMKIGGKISDNDIDELAEVRNAFSHNHYPNQEIVNVDEHELGKIAKATKERITPKK